MSATNIYDVEVEGKLISVHANDNLEAIAEARFLTDWKRNFDDPCSIKARVVGMTKIWK